MQITIYLKNVQPFTASGEKNPVKKYPHPVNGTVPIMTDLCPKGNLNYGSLVEKSYVYSEGLTFDELLLTFHETAHLLLCGACRTDQKSHVPPQNVLCMTHIQKKWGFDDMDVTTILKVFFNTLPCAHFCHNDLKVEAVCNKQKDRTIFLHIQLFLLKKK